MGIFDTVVRRFVPEDTEQKIPHMGWNALTCLKGPLFAGIPEGSYAYFVHSYYAPVSAFSVAECNYVIPFSAALNKGNFYLNGLAGIGYTRIDSGITSSNLNFISGY